MKLQKQHPTDYNLLIVQDLWQAHYQIFVIISLKEFLKSNVNRSMMIKKLKLAELNTKIVSAVLNTKTLKMT